MEECPLLINIYPKPFVIKMLLFAHFTDISLSVKTKETIRRLLVPKPAIICEIKKRGIMSKVDPNNRSTTDKI